MRSSRLKGIVALEEEQVVLDKLENPPVVDEVPVEDNANSLETDLVEAAGDEADLTGMEESAEDGLEVVEALENLRLVVARANKEGGLPKVAAEAITVSLESHYKRVGLTVKKVAPALEQFTGVSEKARATIALEADIKARAKEIFDKIKDAIKRAIKWVADFFMKIFGMAEKLQARGKSLADRASKVTGEASSNEITNGRLAGELVLDGKVAGDASAADRLAEVFKTVYAEYPKYLAELENIAKEATAENKSVGIQEILSNRESKLSLGLDVVSNPAEAGISVGDGGVVVRSKELPGGKALTIVLEPTSAEKSTGGMIPFNKAAAAFKGETVPVMDKVAMQSAAKTIAELGGQLVQARQHVSRMTKVKNDLIGFVDKAARKSTDEEGKNDLKSSADALRFVLKLVDKPFLEFNSYGIKAGKAVCDQIEESLKAHGGKKEEKPADTEQK